MRCVSTACEFQAQLAAISAGCMSQKGHVRCSSTASLHCSSSSSSISSISSHHASSRPCADSLSSGCYHSATRPKASHRPHAIARSSRSSENRDSSSSSSSSSQQKASQRPDVRAQSSRSSDDRDTNSPSSSSSSSQQKASQRPDVASRSSRSETSGSTRRDNGNGTSSGSSTGGLGMGTLSLGPASTPRTLWRRCPLFSLETVMPSPFHSQKITLLHLLRVMPRMQLTTCCALTRIHACLEMVHAICL